MTTVNIHYQQLKSADTWGGWKRLQGLLIFLTNQGITFQILANDKKKAGKLSVSLNRDNTVTNYDDIIKVNC